MEQLAKAIICPDCGLPLRVTREASGSTFTYDLGDWQQRCKRVDLDHPAWCLLQRDGTSEVAALETHPVYPLRRVG
jgi:hypothetical protein